MKTILAIFAIVCGAALVALWEEGPPPADVSGGVLPASLKGNLAPPDVPNPDVAPVAQGGADATQIGKARVNDLLRLAGERIDRYASIAASLRYRIQLFDSELIGSGLYQQAGQGSERRIRMELRTQLGEETTSRLQVCDGDALWTYVEAPDGTQLEWLDLLGRNSDVGD
jgi:hypothetical protein